MLEVTRFCLSPRLRASERRAIRNQLISALVDYALSHGIRTLTGVAGMSWLSQILTMGWRCEVLGPPQSVDGVMSGAFRIEVDNATPQGLRSTGIYVPGTIAAIMDHERGDQISVGSDDIESVPEPDPPSMVAELWTRRLRDAGYCIIPDAVPTEWVEALNADLDARFTATPFCDGGFYGPRTKRFGSLLTQGARLVGTYDSVVAFGQHRALLVWQRIIMPDGSSVVIDNLPATDTAGYSGLEDEVDFHTWQLLEGVGLSTLLGVSSQATFGSSQSNLVQAIRQSTSESANQAGQHIVEKDLNVQPTLTVRPGWPLRIVVHKDLILRPYQG